MKISREIKTAILVIASIVLFIWGYSFLKGSDLFSSDRTFFVEYDNVEGLSASAPVTINGLNVGKVENITLNPQNGKLLVQLIIKNDFQIAKSSQANIYEPGFIGGKQIQIVPNFEDKNFAQSGDFLKGSVVPGMLGEVASQFEPLKAKIEKVTESADAVLVNINDILDQQTKLNIKSSLEKMNLILSEFAQASKSINGIVTKNAQNIDGTLTNLNKVSNNFAVISDEIAAANIGATIQKMESTLAEVNAIVADLNNGKGTVGKLLKDDALYNNFTKTSKELELLLQDVRLNPTRYINVSIFGKKNKPYVAPTEEVTP